MNINTENDRLNQINFKASRKIKRLKRGLQYTENIKKIWSVKDRIKELEHIILINEQQIKFNLLQRIAKNESRIKNPN